MKLALLPKMLFQLSALNAKMADTFLRLKCQENNNNFVELGF